MQSPHPLDFDLAYDRYADGIYRFCYRLTGRTQDAEDLVQETFLAALRGREQFQSRSSDATWLYRIARNKAIKLLRRRSLEDRFWFRLKEDSINAETQAFADESLSHLQLPLREAFLLVKVEGFTSGEAAQILKIPEGTVRFRIHQAVIQLRSYWQGADEVASKGVPHAV